MKEIKITNKRVLALFKETEKFDLGLGKILNYRNCDENNYKEYSEIMTSDQCLKDKINMRDAWSITHRVNFLFGETPGACYFLDNFKKITNYDHYYTSGYSPYGFVGWHSDADVNGWYLQVTYCTGDQGYFRYYDRECDKIVTLKDTSGWTVRAVELKKDYDNMFWHCIVTSQPRYSFLLFFDDKDKFLLAQKALTDDIQ